MNIKKKKKLLEKLKKKIIKKESTDRVWFYEQYFEDHPNLKYKGNPIQGFLGTGKAFFISPNPNKVKIRGIEYRKRKNWKLEKFLDELVNNNLGNTHLTDFCKERKDNGEADNYWQEIENDNKKDLTQELTWLEKELNIVEPKLTIILGKTKGEIIQKLLKKLAFPNIQITYHYSARQKNHREELIKTIKEVAEYLKSN